jgi:hypothetical protein
MNRITVILLAALDAVIALGVGVAIPLVPLTVMWGVQSGLTSDWEPFWRAASDIWLLGHGVDLTVTLDPQLAASFGLAGSTVFTVTVAALGFALLTAVFGVRTGRRAWATPHPVSAAIAGVVTFGLLAALITLSSHDGPVVPSLLQGASLPAAVFAGGIAVGLIAAELRHRADPTRTDTTRMDQARAESTSAEPARGEHPEASGRGGRLPWPVAGWSPAARAVAAASLRGGVAAAMLLVAAGSVVLALLMLLNYARVIDLYQSLQPGALGAAALTLAQLAFVPNAVLWTASWLAGPGFALGTGTAVDVTQTTLGPLPAVPLLGALPQNDPGFGLIAVLVPVACAALAGFLLRRRLEHVPAASGLRGVGGLALAALGSAIVAGAVFALLAWWSGGALGPGRLAHAGPDPLFVGAVVAAEVLVGTALGLSVRWGAEEASEPPTLLERRARATLDAAATAPRPATPAPTVARGADRSVTARAAGARPAPGPRPATQRAAAKARVPGTGSVTEALAWLDELGLERAGARAPVPTDAAHSEADTEPVPVVRPGARDKRPRRR